jgi:amino acid adenylation domain-containing protein
MNLKESREYRPHPTDPMSPPPLIPACHAGPTNDFVPFRKEEIDQSIATRFEQQVAKHSDRLAIKTRTQALTYAALNQAANRVAQAILAERGETEEPVALLFEPGAPGITSIFGALKAGKILVPLDPSLPRARLSLVLEESQAALLVTQTKYLSLARELAENRCQLLNIEQSDRTLAAENPGLPLSPDRLAYILYTSGSTGRPKGVFWNHRGELHRIMTYTNNLRVSAKDRLSLIRSLSFGAGLRDTFVALLNGAALFPFHLKEEGVAALANWLIQEAITVFILGPTTIRHFMDNLAGEERFPQLRLLGLGGEMTYNKDIELCRRHIPPECLIFAHLATTEAGCISRYFIDRETQLAGNITPAGYPEEDREICLLDDAGNAVGFNQIGEIAVKGRYLGCGYWRRPDLTRAAFLPDLEGGDKRVYRTGDLGIMLPDGCLVPLGRKDFQVKVRGYRVESAEVEIALLKLDNVKEAVVVGQADPHGEQRLVAYLVPATQPAPPAGTLRHLLAQDMPDYMIPSAFVWLNSLPLTPNGKVDRRALPAPGRDRPELEQAYQPPRTPTEEILAGIWAELLGLERVGIHDNFFALGGHSLLATRVVFRVQQAFGVELPLRSLFEAPTIAGLALVIVQHLAARADPAELAAIWAEIERSSGPAGERPIPS